MKDVLVRHESNYEAVEQEYAQSKKELEGPCRSSEMAQRYKYYQELRGYVTDLVECLDEKVGLQIRKRIQSNVMKKNYMFLSKGQLIY